MFGISCLGIPVPVSFTSILTIFNTGTNRVFKTSLPPSGIASMALAIRLVNIDCRVLASAMTLGISSCSSIFTWIFFELQYGVVISINLINKLLQEIVFESPGVCLEKYKRFFITLLPCLTSSITIERCWQMLSCFIS